MIKSKVFSGKETDENGFLEFGFKFNGYLVELNVDYGELGPDTKLVFSTSTGRELIIMGNDSTVFPYSPRRSGNEEKIGAAGAELSLTEKYVNAGEFKIRFENADDERLLGFVEVIYETD